MHWEDQVIIFLIEKVQQNEFVWNQGNTQYKNKNKKHKFWSDLVCLLNEEFPGKKLFTYGKVVKKWNNLKAYYSAQNQNMFKISKSGAGADGVETLHEEITWKYYEKLSFLKEITVQMPSVNNYNKRNLNVLYSEENSNSSTSESVECRTVFEESGTQCSDSLSEHIDFRNISSALNSTPTFPNASPEDSCKNQSNPQIEITQNIFRPIATMPQGLERISHTEATTSPMHIKKKPRTAKTLTNTSGNSYSYMIENILQASNDLQHIQRRQKTSQKSANDLFGKSIASEIDKLDVDLQIAAKKEIFTIVMNFQEKNHKSRDKN